MQRFQNSKQHKVTALVAVTIFGALLIAYIESGSTIVNLTTIFVLTVVVASQTLLYLEYQKLQQRQHKYHQIRAQRSKDEALALRILNHINSTTSRIPDHAHVWQKPLHGFSGDLALAYENDKGHKYTLLADLTGHGIAAAISAAPVASIFRATVRNGLSVEEIVTELNNRLLELLPSGFFCCAAIVLEDNGKLTACNAGLPELLITDDDGVIINTITSTQLPLGIDQLMAEDVELFTRHYAQRHQLYAFTDGLIETHGANDEFFDIDKITTLLSSKNNGAGRLERITESFESFAKDSEISDDISIVEVMIR